MSLSKIILHSTSRMSLNDRFTGLIGSTDVSPHTYQMRTQLQATRKNQRLAQQMEHRPAVIAALRGPLRGRGRGLSASRGSAFRGTRGGLLRGARGARGFIRVGTAASIRGVRGAGRGGVSLRGNTGRVRGAQFRTVASVRSGGRVSVPVKQRLAVQSRLSNLPTAGPSKSASRGFARGRGTRRRGVGLRGRSNLSRGSFQSRTFSRGRGGRGGYSRQWQNGD